MKKKHYLLKQITLICACFALVFGAGLIAKAAPANSGVQGTTVYLNGQTGDDTRDGLSKDTAVKTFTQAKKLAAADANIKTIDVTGTVALQGDVNLKGTQAIVKRDPAFNGNLFTVASIVTLSDITVDGGGSAAPSDAGALIKMTSGTMNIKDGTVLQNNRNGDRRSDTFAEGGAVFVRAGANDQAVVNMTGGTISGNSANWGGGLYIGSGTFNMSGGVIEHNTAEGQVDFTGFENCGGGVELNGQDREAVMNFSGGTIKNNRSEGNGGGISVGTSFAANHAITLNMTGGSVEGNTAGKAGGGIFVQAGYLNPATWGVANVTGGKIQNNQMNAKKDTPNTAFGGGGIYVNGYAHQYKGTFHDGVLNLKNAVIQNNQAAYAGGGYAACPSSDTHIYVTDGAAFLGNQAKSAKAIYILSSSKYGAHSGSPAYTISPSMLGGSPYNWQNDDGTEVPLNHLEGKLDGDKEESIALSTAKTNDAQAAKRAKVWITGNTSTTRGGGIGSNGTVNIGTEPKTEIAVKVDKKWADAKKAHPDQVTVQLYRAVKGETPVYVGPETVSADQNWTMTFKNLPTEDPDGNAYTYTVKEKAVDGYTPTITGDQTKGFVITNAPTPAKPVTPGNKTDNTAPGTKTQPVSGKTGVKTGDPTQAMAYLILMGAALAVLAGIGIYKTKKA
jgi:hypothetical protein